MKKKITTTLILTTFASQVSALSLQCVGDCGDELALALKNSNVVHFPSGEITIKEFDFCGAEDPQIQLLGAIGKTTIKTDSFCLTANDSVLIRNIHFEGIDSSKGSKQDQVGALVVIKDVPEVKFEYNSVTNSARGLLSFQNVQSYQVLSNTFSQSGLARVDKDLNDDVIRIDGTALGIDGGNGRIIGNNFDSIRGIGFWLGGKETSNIVTNNLVITENTFQNLEYGTGIYIEANSPKVFNNTSGVQITDNTFQGYTVNGIRINGVNQTVSSNTFSTEASATAIKAHYLKDTYIGSNTINGNGTDVGILIQPEGGSTAYNIENIEVLNNYIKETINGVVTEYVNRGIYRNVEVGKNQFYDTVDSAIIFRAIEPSNTLNNSAYSNTISNGNRIPYRVAAVNIQNQSEFYFANNWIYGRAGSGNYAHVYVENVKNSKIERNTITTPSSIDKAYGGFKFKNSRNNAYSSNSLVNLDPGIHCDNQSVNTGCPN